jgi:anthranilate 1,2-dioxygenase small subunit
VSAAPDADRLFRMVGSFHAAYARSIDDNAAAGWPEMFAEDCLYIVTTADNHRRGMQAGLIYADGRGMLKDRITALEEANIYEQHGYRHLLGQPWIQAGADGEITAETSFLVARIMRTGETDVFATGRYLDRFVVQGDALLLRERIVVCDSNRIDTLLALPL